MSRLLSYHQRLVLSRKLTLFDRLILAFLIPLSIFYGIVSWGRNLLFSTGLKSICRVDIPVVSVGNITAGGTGKTPVVDFLLKAFIRRGIRPAVVSRGYGGHYPDSVACVSDGCELLMDARQSGDEPYLLARRNPSCPVWVAAKRILAAEEIAERKQADVIIMDDGFQHRYLHRDLNIVLLDALFPFGNGWPLPAGNLREFKFGLQRADLIIRTKCQLGIKTIDICADQKSYQSFHRLSDCAVALSGEIVPLEKLQGISLVAFSGIAAPHSFFDELSDNGLELSASLPLSDHIDYGDSAVIDRINAQIRSADALVTTEKDAVKLTADMFECPCFYIPLNVTIDQSEDFIDSVCQRLWRNS